MNKDDVNVLELCYNTTFLIKYQMLSILESLKRLL